MKFDLSPLPYAYNELEPYIADILKHDFEEIR